ncbi:MAG: hypothetical protein JST78_09500 [Bacteroidetes bacterium]|nr:hypothetical protein [Bacteroidota bacterium]
MAITTPSIPGLDPKYLQILSKEDSLEKLAYMVGKDPKYFLTATEFEVLRDFVNKLRDDIESSNARVEKRILLSSIVSTGVYIAQPGDENKFIVIENDIVAGTTQIFTINGEFPANSTFMVYLLDNGYPFGINYQVAGGTIDGLPFHYSDYKDVAVIRKLTTAPSVKWLATYQIGSR